MKRVLFFLLLCGAIAACILTPYNVLNTLDSKQNFEAALREYESARSGATDSDTSLARSKTVFDSSRTFEIAYNDITRLVEVLRNTSTVTLTSVNVANPETYFTTGGPWSADNDAQAIIISVTTDDSAATLRIIDKMQLPLYEVTVTEPNIVDFIFLTGGGTR